MARTRRYGRLGKADSFVERSYGIYPLVRYRLYAYTSIIINKKMKKTVRVAKRRKARESEAKCLINKRMNGNKQIARESNNVRYVVVR